MSLAPHRAINLASGHRFSKGNPLPFVIGPSSLKVRRQAASKRALVLCRPRVKADESGLHGTTQRLSSHHKAQNETLEHATTSVLDFLPWVVELSAGKWWHRNSLRRAQRLGPREQTSAQPDAQTRATILSHGVSTLDDASPSLPNTL